MKVNIYSLCKKIKKKVIYEDISMAFVSGRIYGLVGENGSGKTMLIRTLCGLVNPTSGRVQINDSVGSKMDLSRISVGVIIENVSLYQDMTGYDNLYYLSHLVDEVPARQICELMRRVNLEPDDKRLVAQYSLGMRQRLAIAQAFINQPDMVLLDEPTNALDADSQVKVRALIKEYAGKDHIVILASHSKEDIEELCDEVYELSGGRVVNHLERGDL